MKKKIFSVVGVVLIVAVVMLFPSNSNKTINEQTSSSEAASNTVTVNENSDDNENSANSEEKPKEFLGGIKIGASNLILLAVCGTILLVNKIKDIRAEKSKETEE